MLLSGIAFLPKRASNRRSLFWRPTHRTGCYAMPHADAGLFRFRIAVFSASNGASGKIKWMKMQHHLLTRAESDDVFREALNSGQCVMYNLSPHSNV
jgi:hypothetical protein